MTVRGRRVVRLASASLVLLLGTHGASADFAHSTWGCAIATRFVVLVAPKAGSGSSGGPPGHLRGRSAIDGVALVNDGSTWSLEGTGFERLEGDLGIGRPRLLVANAASPLLGAWLHDALLRQFVGFDLEVTGAVLAGILRSNGAGSRGRGAFVGTFTARDAGTNVYVGRVVLRLRCTDGAR